MNDKPDTFDLLSLPLGMRFELETRGKSMRWFIQEGDVLLAQKVVPQHLSIGDIAVFKPRIQNETITHRLIFKKNKSGKVVFIFKGDDLINFDEPIVSECIIGKIIAVVRGSRRVDLQTIRGKIISLSFFFFSICITGVRIFRRKLSWKVKIKPVYMKIFHRYFWIRLLLFNRPVLNLNLKKTAQNFVIKTSDNKLLRPFYIVYYRLAAHIFKAFYSNFSCVDSIYIRRQMARGTCQPGTSDIDLSVIIKEMPSDKEALFLKSFWRWYFLIKKIFPILGEVEIVTKQELVGWESASGVRTCEAMSWRIVYGRDIKPDFSFLEGSDSAKLNFLTEAMQSFWSLTLNMFGNRKEMFQRHEYRRFFKRLIDTLRFVDKIFNSVVLEDRQEYISDFITQQKDSLFGKELMKFVNKVMDNVSAIENVMLLTIYSHLVGYIDRKCQVIIQNFFSHKACLDNERFTIKASNEKIDIDHGTLARFRQEIVSRVIAVCGDDILSILSNSHVYSSHIFVVIKQGMNMEKIKQAYRQVFITLSGFIPAIVTKNILQCMCYSLFLESSFNYWHIIDQANIDFGIDPKNYLTVPADDIILSMLRNNVGVFNLCFRMFPENRIPVYLVYHSIDQIIRLHLALDQGIILSSLKDAVNEYKIHYKENDANVVSRLEKYLPLSRKELSTLSNKNIFYNNFEFIRKEMRRLNYLISSN